MRIRTDLALEAKELWEESAGKTTELPGVVARETRRRGVTVTTVEILDRRGIQAFLDAEEAAIRSLDCAHTVIAPGGSAVCRPAAMAHLARLGRVAYLQVPLAELERRVDNITTRGIAMAPGETLAHVFAQREPLYRKYADLTVDVGAGQSLEDTVAAVAAGLPAL